MVMAKHVRFLFTVLFFVAVNVVSVTSVQAKDKKYDGDVREELELLGTFRDIPARYTLDVVNK
jgi:hypothetical protein